MATIDPQAYQAEYVDGYQQGYVQGYRKGYQQGLEEGRPWTMKMRGWIQMQLARHMRPANPCILEAAAAILAQYGLYAPPALRPHRSYPRTPTSWGVRSTVDKPPWASGAADRYAATP
jgi:hypothetical protein